MPENSLPWSTSEEIKTKTKGEKKRKEREREKEGVLYGHSL